MPRIPEETIERVREANDIVDVVGQYVQLRRRGRNYFGLCPFHQEDTPSFSVAPDKQIFHCFGCGKGGNVFSFLMEYERITFPEAVQRLADSSGISLPEISSAKSTETPSAGPLYEANAFAMRFFEKALYSDQGEKALAYLRSRDFSDDTLKAFRVGFAPDAWDSLVTWGPKNNHDLQALHRAGLISRRKDGGGFYDRFRNRIMFPIINVAGRVVAFGGRAMDPEDPAKYMNSPESPVYQKRKILYGLNQARDAVRKEEEVFIVEGYTDLMRLWEHGFTNVVAVSGTAFTADHAKTLNRYSRRSILCYDSDAAGIQATLRAGNLLLEAGVEVRCIALPDGHDPDSYIAEESAEAFRQRAGEADSLLKFRVDRTAGDLGDASSRTVFIRQTLRDIAEISDGLVRDLQVQELAELMRVDEQRLRRELRKQSGSRRSRSERSSAESTTQSGPIKFAGDEQAQYELLKLLLSEEEELITYILEHLDLEEFTHPLLRIVANRFMDILSESSVLQQEHVLDQFADEDLEDIDQMQAVRNLISRMLFEIDDTEQVVPREKLARDCLKRLELARLREEIDRLNAELREAENGQEDTLKLLQQRQSLEKMKKEIQAKYR